MTQKHRIKFNEVSSPITGLMTKFGGKPCWLAEPQWPLSRTTGNPMRFVCQIKITKDLFPNAVAEMAYLFITDEDDWRYVEGTYLPDGGENALILQPGIPAVPTKGLTVGPTLYRMEDLPGKESKERMPVEFEVELTKLEDDEDLARGRFSESKIGGRPAWIQAEDLPFNGGCDLLLQLDSCVVPFEVNFGDFGVGYAFLNAAGDQAKFFGSASELYFFTRV